MIIARMTRRVRALCAFVLVWPLLLGALGRAEAQNEPRVSAQETYTSMVRAMSREAVPSSIAYRESVVPHGLTLAIRNRNGSPAPALVFSQSGEHEEFVVHQSPGVMDVLDETTGVRYSGAKIFWAASWSDARVVNARAGAATAAPVAMTPAPQAQAGSVAALDRARDDVIGEVSTVNDRFYRIEDAGITDIDGFAVSHLHLVARSDPTNHPLTDIFVDTTTFLLRRAIASFKNEAYVSGYAGTMTLDFDRVKQYWMVVGGRVQASSHVFFGRQSGTADFTIHDVETPS